MATPVHDMADPDRIADRIEFGAALTALREAAKLTVRELAKRAEVPTATVSGYLSGRHLPHPTQPDAFLAVLAACGVTDEGERERWLATLRRVRQAPGSRSASALSPYPGLASFQPEDSAIFFGRSELIAEIRARIEAIRTDHSEHRLVMVTGPSGSGKSSVLRAGIVPGAIADELMPLVMTPGDRPYQALTRLLAEHLQLPDEDVIAAFTTGNAPSRPILLVVDQAEELFTTCTDRARRVAFLDAIEQLTSSSDAAGRPRIIVLAALRADFYAAAADEPVLLAGLRHEQIVVGAMTRAELTEAIVAPAAAAALHVDAELVETLLDELAPRDRPGAAHDRGALPLLAHALHATWKVSRRGRMTVADYVSTGGIAGAIERTAEAVWADLDDESREVARSIFLRLVFVDDDTMVSRRRVTWTELYGSDSVTGERSPVSAIVQLFADARLLTLRTDTVEISHEALIGAWRRLGAWVDADRSALRWHRRLSDAARVWEQSGGDESYLLRSGRLAEVTDLLDSGRVVLNDVEQRFITASVKQAEVVQTSQRRQRRRLRLALAAVAILALVTSGLAVVAWRAEESANARAAEATAARDDAQSRELAIAADRARGTDPALAAQLSMVAYDIAPTVDARSAVLDSTALPLPSRIISQEGPTFIAIHQPSQVLAVTQAVSGGVDLWSLADPGSPTLLAALMSAQPKVQQFSVAISPDGRQLAAGDAAGLVERWDISNPKAPEPLPGPGVVFPSGVLTLAYSPDGQQLAAGGAGGVVQRWRISDDGEARALPSVAAGELVSALAWAPDSSMLWVGDDVGGVTGWSVDSDGTIDGADDPVHAAVTLSSGPAVVSALAVGPHGATLAAGTKRGELHVWRHDAAEWVADDTQPNLAGWVDALAYAPDGAHLAVGSTGNDIRVFDADTLAERAAMVAPGPVTGVAYTADGALATGSSDGFTRVWPQPGVVIGPVGDTIFDVAQPVPGRLDVGAASQAGGLVTYDVTDRAAPRGAVSPMVDGGDVRIAGILASDHSGRLVAMGAAGGEVQLWDTSESGAAKAIGAPFPAAPDFVNGLAFSPDGTMLAVASDAGVVDLWDVSRPEQPRRLAESENTGGLVASVAFQPGGTLLAAATTNGNVPIWDIADPTTPRQVADLTGLTGYALSVSFSSDGSLIAAGGSGREVRLWRADDFSPVGTPLTGPANDIGMVAFDPTGPRLAAVTYSGVLWQWDVRDPEQVELLAKQRAASGVLYGMAWSSDGATLAAGGSAQRVWTWTANAEDAMSELCSAAGAGITRHEWELYVQERDYTPPCG